MYFFFCRTESPWTVVLSSSFLTVPCSETAADAHAIPLPTLSACLLLVTKPGICMYNMNCHVVVVVADNFKLASQFPEVLKRPTGRRKSDMLFSCCCKIGVWLLVSVPRSPVWDSRRLAPGWQVNLDMKVWSLAATILMT